MGTVHVHVKDSVSMTSPLIFVEVVHLKLSDSGLLIVYNTSGSIAAFAPGFWTAYLVVERGQ